MGNRSTAEVKRELESEREGLERAATTLRRQSGNVAKRFALTAAAAVVVGLAVKAVASHVFDRDAKGKQGRARLPFPDRD